MDWVHEPHPDGHGFYWVYRDLETFREPRDGRSDTICIIDSTYKDGYRAVPEGFCGVWLKHENAWGDQKVLKVSVEEAKAIALMLLKGE